MVAGGGVQGGRIIGGTDKIAGEPVDEPHHVSDYFATIYKALGYGSNAIVTDLTNRPHHITQGRPIAGLF